MLVYTLRRILLMIPTLLVISFITFVIIKLPPGDFLSNQITELRSQGSPTFHKNSSEQAKANTSHTAPNPVEVPAATGLYD